MADKKNMDDLLAEELYDIIELVDEEGNVVKFKLVDVTEYKGEKYTILAPAEPNSEVDEYEVVIFRLNEAENTLDPIEDDALLDEVFAFFQSEYDEYGEEEEYADADPDSDRDDA